MCAIKLFNWNSIDQMLVVNRNLKVLKTKQVPIAGTCCKTGGWVLVAK